MITHDVDEAIYLADKILLMTNGPGAMIAEIVTNPLPKDRARDSFHKHPLYYALRNHLIDFLVLRSKTFAGEIAGKDFDRRNPPVVNRRPSTGPSRWWPRLRRPPSPRGRQLSEPMTPFTPRSLGDKG